jgi:hypothetical protein
VRKAFNFHSLSLSLLSYVYKYKPAQHTYIASRQKQPGTIERYTIQPLYYRPIYISFKLIETFSSICHGQSSFCYPIEYIIQSNLHLTQNRQVNQKKSTARADRIILHQSHFVNHLFGDIIDTDGLCTHLNRNREYIYI